MAGMAGAMFRALAFSSGRTGSGLALRGSAAAVDAWATALAPDSGVLAGRSTAMMLGRTGGTA